MPRKTIRIVVTLSVVFVFAICTIARQQKLTNQDIIKMVKAGLSADIVVQTIKTSQAAFDVSADGLINLKKEGIPDQVIQAMVSHKNGQSATGGSQAETGDVCSGSNTDTVILLDGENRVEMQHAQTGVKASGGLVPFSSVKARAVLQGNHSPLRIHSTTPVFDEFYFPTSVRLNEIVMLTRVAVKSDRREIEVYKAGLSGAGNSYSKENYIPITIEDKGLVRCRGKEVRSYRVKVVTAIPPGEYCLVVAGAYFFDFGIDAGK